MSQNITLLGASYSDVPSVVLPKTGGGTAQFDDTTIASNAASASDIANGKLAWANGELVTGTASGGGVDMPIFHVIMNSSGQSVVSVTCDWTFAECADYLDLGKSAALVGISIQGSSDEYIMSASSYLADAEEFVFVANEGGKPSADVTIYSDDTCTFTVPTSAVTTLTATENRTYTDTWGRLYNEVTVDVPTGGASIKTATGTFTGNGTRTIDVSCSWEPDLVYFTSNPGTTASSGTVAAIIVRGMMTATRYRNNSTTNSHYAIPDIANMNSSGSSYSWRATYANSKVTLYCYSSNARGLLTNGRTYSYTFMKWTYK